MPNQFSVNLGLDIVPQSKDPDNLGDLYRLYNASKSLAGALDDYTGAIGANQEDWSVAGTEYLLLQRMTRIYVQFAVTVTTGQILTINSAGNAALAATGAAQGWAPAPVAAGAWGEMRLMGLHSAVAGLTPGTWYYSSATAGAITATVTAQKVGFAIAANKLFFNPS
jgi:hypothetical protein